VSRIEARGLTVTLGGRTVLADVDLALAPGEILGLVGPNGAGKTTLLRTLIGLAAPESGEVTVEARPLAGWRRAELASHLAYLPQNAPCHWPLTVSQVVMLGRLPRLRPWIRPSSEDDEAVRRALRQVDAELFETRRVDELSDGERARVMLARALAGEPAVLLADEPVAGLDPGHQLQVMRLLAALAGQQRSVIVTLHDLTLAARFCHRLVILDAGRVLASGAPAEVLTAENLAAAFAIRAEIGTRNGETFLVPWEGIADHEGK
jgi:iron complex transport system ATP-binding protein